MASESTADGSVSVALPADLDAWLDEQAARLDVDRETVLIRLLAAYRAVAEPGGDPDAAVEATLDDALDDRLDAVRQKLDERVDALEDDYLENLEDVRQRVVQVKRETDGKAPRDHDHSELDRIDDVADRLDALEGTVADLEARMTALEEAATDGDDPGDLRGRLDETAERLRTVAWAVADLREGREAGRDAVDRIKRAAARADVERARCENCASGVDLALLTDPQCPHCGATVTDVDPADGFFSKPRLLVASQLEAGDRR